MAKIKAISSPNHPMACIFSSNLLRYERLNTKIIPIVIKPPRHVRKVQGLVSTNLIRSVSGESIKTPNTPSRYPLVRLFNEFAGISGCPIDHMTFLIVGSEIAFYFYKRFIDKKAT